MSKPTEDEKVFTHEIRVGWADCDPAQIAYTGRIPYFALEAIDAWWDAKVGDDWFRMNIDKGYGTPFVHLSVDFRSPVTPRYRLQCQVRLMRLGDSSIRFSVEGYQDGTLCFEGQFVEVFVDAKTHLTKIKAPDFVREKVAHLALDA